MSHNYQLNILKCPYHLITCITQSAIICFKNYEQIWYLGQQTFTYGRESRVNPDCYYPNDVMLLMMYHVPMATLVKIDSICADFFWVGKIYKIVWTKLI